MLFTDVHFWKETLKMHFIFASFLCHAYQRLKYCLYFLVAHKITLKNTVFKQKTCKSLGFTV